jgi:hypothetical protein
MVMKQLRSGILFTVGLAIATSSSCVEETTEGPHFEQVGGHAAGGGNSGQASSSSSPSSSSSSSSVAQSQASSTVASSTASATVSSSSGSGGSGCSDPGEPNDSEQDAVPLLAQGDCDKIEMVAGTLGDGDGDWFKYQGNDGFCSVDPTRTLSADGQVRLCKFADCPGAVVTCPNDTTPFKSPDGLDGCCAQAGFAMTVDCDGFSDDATIYLYLDKPINKKCTNYTVSYHY